MTLPPVVGLVTLGVADVQRATDFYVSLGWPLSSHSIRGEVSFFRTAGTRFALFGIEDMAEDMRQPATALAPQCRNFTLAINLPSDAAVDAAVAAVVAAGGTVLKAPEKTSWGGYSSYIADLDGHAWEIAHNPGWPLGDDGFPVIPE